MIRWLRMICVLGLVGLLAGAGTFAAARAYEVAIQADGTTLGTASGTIEVTKSGNGRLAWALSDGKFAPANVAGTTVVWSDENLSGTGTAEDGQTVNLKEFEVTVKQTSGVDISYRFRLSVSLDDGAVKTVSVVQLP